MLSDRDRARLEAVPYDPAATPAYDDLGGFLAWPDELPSGLTPDGHAYVRDLLIARGHLHRNIAPEAWWPAEVLTRWREASSRELAWNGFRRVVLRPEDAKFLERAMSAEDP